MSFHFCGDTGFRHSVCFLFLYLFYFVLGHGVVQYFNVASAIYAKYKLHGFQYPPGNRIGVSFIDDGSNASE